MALRNSLHGFLPFFIGFFGAFLISVDSHAQSSNRSKAYTLYKKLTCSIPSDADLNNMETLVGQGNIDAAADVAIGKAGFYDCVLRDFFSGLAQDGGDPKVDLNDATATAVIMVREDVPANQLLTGTSLYVADSSFGVVGFSMGNPKHYNAVNPLFEKGQISLANPAHFSELNQTQIVDGDGKTTNDPLGILTTRAGGESFFNGGTNRRPWKGMLENFMCMDMFEVHDLSITTSYIRRDVDRAPGGNPEVYTTQCVGCHARMDIVSNAFSHYNWANNKGHRYDASKISKKVTQNPLGGSPGFVPSNDDWIFYPGIYGDKFGWDGPTTGSGAQALGNAVTQSRAFSECMSNQVYRKVCGRDLSSDPTLLNTLANEFESNDSFNMKTLFKSSVATCI